MSTAEREETNVEALWLSYPEAQKITGLGRTKLWEIVNDTETDVKAARVGRAVRISRRSLESYMERQASE